MRQLLVGMTALVAITAAGVPEAAAAQRPYCLDADRTHLKDCSYYTFQQCLETASGLGGICYYNPAILWAERLGTAEPSPRSKAKARRTY
jgi:hypothetical protein